MAFPVAPTEAGGAKLHFGTTDGNVAAGWFAVDTGVTGTGTNTVGFLGIATHVHDDAAGSPGGLSTSSIPLVVAGAVRDDALGGLTPAAGDAVYLLVDANGALWTHDDALDAAIDGAYLNVNANIAGTDFVGGAGAVAAGVQRVTLASDDPGVALLITIDSDTNDIKTAVELIDNTVAVLGTATYTETSTSGLVIGAVRNDVLATLANTDNEIAPLQVDADGALYITGAVERGTADDGAPVKIGGRAQASEAQPEEVADNERVDALFDRSGYLRVRGDFDPSYADINDALSPNNTIVAAQAGGKRIAVWSILLVSDGTVDARWEDGAGGGAFTGQIPLEAREGYSISAGGLVPLFVGSAATLLNLELSAAVNVHGGVSYSVIDD